jgi:hypothetical protein
MEVDLRGRNISTSVNPPEVLQRINAFTFLGKILSNLSLQAFRRRRELQLLLHVFYREDIHIKKLLPSPDTASPVSPRGPKESPFNWGF